MRISQPDYLSSLLLASHSTMPLYQNVIAN
uniref:Uncharacterized protein n=1 Tax=Anguilla anguilla TaxID=7936 RepID=A0A0E9T116_ANGAN